MAESVSTLRVNSDRMLDMFNKLALIGATGDGGVNRVTFSGAHLAARKWFREQIERSGLDFSMDGGGNYSATLTCDCSNAQTLLLGSHLDSVPNGGRFDGALGVITALEVLRTVKENGIKLKVNLEAIDFTDEEGTLVGLLGSAALAGHLHLDDLKNPRGGRENLEIGMARGGLTDESMLSAARPKDHWRAYLVCTLNRANGKRNGINVGIVSAIVGIRSNRLNFIGRTDHAGSTLMTDRANASLGASAFTLAAREIVIEGFSECVVNVGKMEFTPGAFNIVPALVNVALEFRAPSDEEFDQVGSALLVCDEMEAIGLAWH